MVAVRQKIKYAYELFPVYPNKHFMINKSKVLNHESESNLSVGLAATVRNRKSLRAGFGSATPAWRILR